MIHRLILRVRLNRAIARARGYSRLPMGVWHAPTQMLLDKRVASLSVAWATC